MESRPSFFGDQDVFKEDLNQVILYVDDQFVLRQQSVLGCSGGFANGSGSVLGGGVFGSPADYLLGKNLRTIQGITAGVLCMYSGIALDQNGYLIQLDTEGMDGEVLGMTLGGSSNMYSWPGSPSVLNYVKIAYQESSGSVGSDDLGGSHATRFVPSIYATVDSTPPTSDEILLATFTATVTGEIEAGVVNDKRLYVRTITPASAVILDPITKPVGGWTSVEDHVNAKGSATQTATNPHGLTGADIGLSDTIVPHVLNSHSSGIVAIDGIYDSGVYASFTPSAVDLGAEVVIQFTPPNANAGILVGGYVYTDSIAEISLLNTSLFAEGDGFYNVYMNASGSVLATKSTPDGNDPNNFVLCIIERAGAGSDYTDFYDYRTFRGTRINNIRGQDGETASIAALTRESSLSNNLARIRYQLGRAISGAGSQWAHSAPPLTAGASSNADTYHMHTRTPQANYTINYDGLTGDLENMSLRFYRGALHGNASLYWDKDLDAFKLFSNEAGSIYSNLYVNTLIAETALQIGSSSVSQQNLWDLSNILTAGSGSNADSLHTHTALDTFANLEYLGYYEIVNPSYYEEVMLAANTTDKTWGILAELDGHYAAEASLPLDNGVTIVAYQKFAVSVYPNGESPVSYRRRISYVHPSAAGYNAINDISIFTIVPPGQTIWLRVMGCVAAWTNVYLWKYS